ncbi:hypothetical protein GBAR_LOCUS6198 [Geodia barretti]|uniref:Uncharacterized protein n=1 Tax=Geodia barretti TaxID=519541 RepID=A0AA35RDE2_GEOBA|nr:hypothetical protein GBAR_LOCUS6198 [Geodia barretti]
MLSVDNVDDVGPLGPTNITTIANVGGMVEADTHRGLVDENDPEGVFEITVNVGELGIAGNRAYTLHALAYDGSPDGPDAMYGNRQTDLSPESTIHVKNYLRPDPTVVQLTVDDGTGTNVDSGGPQGTFMFAGYTLEQSSPPIMSIRLEAKRESDPESACEIIGTGDVSSSVDIEDDSLPKVLYHLAEAVDEDSSVVAIDATYPEFSVDNDDDVGPLGPTNIVEVATTAGPVEAEGGWDVTLPDVGELANGTYSFHAESVDAFKNPQTDGLSPKITVIVENRYRPAPEVLALIVDSESITQTNPDSGAPQGTIMLNAYSHEISSPPTTSVKFEVKRKNDLGRAWAASIGTATGSTETTGVSDATFADFIGDLANRAVSAAEASDGGNATVVPISRTYQMWAIDVDTTALEDTIMKDSLAARDASKDDNRYMVRAVPIEEASDFEDPGPSPDATAMFSVDNDDDVAPLGPTNVSVTNVEATGSVFEDAGDGSYTVGGLVDKYDEAVNDEAVNSPYRPVPQVLAFTVGDPTQTNPDSGAPQGTISLYGYSPEITSAPTTSVVFEVKRKNDTEWKAVGTASESSPVTAADDAKLAAADVADVAGENVVTSDTYQRWMIEVDTTTLEDSITADSPGARDHTKDDNQYMVRATAMAEADGSANLSVDGVTAMFSVDNVDDVAPLGPTNVSVTSVDAIDSVLEAAEDAAATPLVVSLINTTRLFYPLWRPLLLSRQRIGKPTNLSGS